MRKRITSILFILLFFILFFIFVRATEKENLHEITPQDKANIKAVTLDYYRSIEQKNYDKALYFFDWEKDELDISVYVEQKTTALIELADILNYNIGLDSIVNDDIEYLERKKKYAVMTVVKIKYQDINETHINEILIFNKKNEKWVIEEIESPDRYIVFRANKYAFTKLPSSLIPLRK
ncbi:MAG: hypothetical protein ACOYVK_15570 [Bacillota bacterium]